MELLGQLSRLLCSQRVGGTTSGERARRSCPQAPGKSKTIVVQERVWSQKQHDSIRCGLSYASHTCVSERKRRMCRRENANVLVSQCSRKRILQTLSSDTRWWICPAGMSRGQDTHAGYQRLQNAPGQERPGPGRGRAARSASGLLAGYLAVQPMLTGPAATR
jgi:hypothetical protein